MDKNALRALASNGWVRVGGLGGLFFGVGLAGSKMVSGADTISSAVSDVLWVWRHIATPTGGVIFLAATIGSILFGAKQVSRSMESGRNAELDAMVNETKLRQDALRDPMNIVQLFEEMRCVLEAERLLGLAKTNLDFYKSRIEYFTKNGPVEWYVPLKASYPDYINSAASGAMDPLGPIHQLINRAPLNVPKLRYPTPHIEYDGKGGKRFDPIANEPFLKQHQANIAEIEELARGLTYSVCERRKKIEAQQMKRIF